MRIKNWSKFQHFKDRKPPWIKLYRDLLDDMEWHLLDAEASKLLVMLWLIASEDAGNLPDIKTLAFRLRMSQKQVNDCISRLGHWVERDDINVISDQYQSVPATELNDSATVELTLGETETETETDTPIPPRGQSPKKANASVSLPTWLITLKAMGEQPIPEDDPVFDYAEEAGIPMDYMRLCWVEFKQRYSQPNAKRYKDWRAVYRKAVRGNWFKLWRVTSDGYALTTEGMQAQRVLEAKAVAA